MENHPVIKLPQVRHFRSRIVFILVGLLAGLVLVPASLAAQAEPRLALVIGNGKYQYNTVLKNPVNDATDVAKALQSAGFEVILRTDAGMDAMQKAVREFGNRLKDQKGVGLIFYSGHGTQVKGKNYLLPVDQDIADEDEVAYKALDVEALLSKMESAGNTLNLVFLDACRNNPFPGASKSGDKGLVAMKVNLPESVIVYATEPGKTASDGEGRNSPFTRALLKNMATPNQDILVLMKKVKAEVNDATNRSQSPRVDQNLSRDFVFVSSATQAVTQIATQNNTKPAPSLAPQFDEIVVTPGSASLTFASAGTLSFQGQNRAVPAGGTLPVRNLAPGDYTATVTYPDGQTENLTITVEPDKTASVAFVYKPAPKATQAPAQTSPGQAFTNSVGMSFVPVVGGSFMMGSINGESDEKPVHQVTVGSFALGKTEVTQAQWQAVMGSNPSHFKGDNQPVETVSWLEVVDYCNRLSQKEGLTPAYTISGNNVTWNKGTSGYRLPTEAEWEFAAKGGTKGANRTVAYAGSDDPQAVAWYSGNAGSTTHLVAQKQSNDLGLYDMSGNVLEWVWDWNAAYSANAQNDPSGAASGTNRVFRGGSWSFSASGLRPASRNYNLPDLRGSNLGFRVLRPQSSR